MNNREFETRLRIAVDHAAPDVFDKILSGCEQREKVIIPFEQPQKRFSIRALSAVAAAFVILAGVLFWGINNNSINAVDSVVMLDVNPSIELKINREEKVIKANTGNEDGRIVLDDMDLRGSSLNVAVNALIGSMVKKGYIDELANSILVTVENQDDMKAADLEQRLSKDINDLLKASSVDGAIISQKLTADSGLEQMAEAHNISLGKAMLIQKIIAENNLLKFEDLAQLSVNDLNLLAGSQNLNISDVAATGSASDKAYIGEQKAKEIALADAGAAESNVSFLSIEMDCDDGMMVYDVEFVYNGVKYDLEIAATDGRIIRHDDDWEDTAVWEKQQIENHLAIDEIRRTVLKHAGFSRNSDIIVEIELDDDRANVYEASFKIKGKEYSYDVDAITGQILQWESERDD